MKKSARILRSQAGFSLIELMVVVAIIGILATIAIPNFNRFQSKAKQSEAKGNLSAIYAAEQSFYAEWTVYHGDFRDIGFFPAGRLNYNVGFAGNGPALAAPFVASTAGTAAILTCFNSGVGAAACNMTFTTSAVIPAYASVSAAACGQAGLNVTPTATAFTASAIGSVGGASNDTWSINEGNIMCNNNNGT